MNRCFYRLAENYNTFSVAMDSYLTDVPDLPDLRSLLAYDPLPSDLTDGGWMITITFRDGAEAAWEAAGMDEAYSVNY